MAALNENSGWFVEVPRNLKAEFRRQYPGRRQMKLLTQAAIEWALRERPTHFTHIPSTDEDRQLHVDHVASVPSEV